MFTVNEGSSARISFTVTDHTGTPTPGSSISTAEMTIFDYDTGEIIYGPTNIQTSINESGVCSLHILGSYNTILDETKPYEKHVCFITVSGIGTNAPEIRNEITFQVQNMKLE